VKGVLAYARANKLPLVVNAAVSFAMGLGLTLLTAALR
jgi:hypothetical protein